MDWFETVMKIVVVVASVGGLLTLKRLLTGPRGDRRYPGGHGPVAGTQTLTPS